jgi:hypothetical protein
VHEYPHEPQHYKQFAIYSILAQSGSFLPRDSPEMSQHMCTLIHQGSSCTVRPLKEVINALKEAERGMPPALQHQILPGLLLGALCMGALLYLYGLASTLPLGDTNIRGMLLIPSLPTPLYIIMGLVALAGVGLTLLASFVQRRRDPHNPQKQRQPRPIRTPWQMLVSTLASCAFLVLGLLWLVRHGPEMQQWLERWRQGLGEIPGMLATGSDSFLRQVDSPTAGYALFIIVVVVYGGLALLGLWILIRGRDGAAASQERNEPQMRQVRQAVTAGLRELQSYADPRLAIIACYARLEHLLEDYGVPAYAYLTPQEYMGAVLQGIELPTDALSGLVQLFEQARYSLHPLDDTARTQATAYLTTIQTHLAAEATLATRV